MFSPCIPMYFLWLLWISILYVSMRSGVFAWTISNISRFTERKNGKIVQIVKFVKLQKIFLLEKKRCLINVIELSGRFFAAKF